MLELILTEEFFRTINKDVSSSLLDREFRMVEEAPKHADGYAFGHDQINPDVKSSQVLKTFNPFLHKGRLGKADRKRELNSFATYEGLHCI